MAAGQQPAQHAADAVLLDGGSARRLGGRHKAFLRVDGATIAERLLVACRPLVTEVLVVTSRPEPWKAFGVRTLADEIAGAGPLAGIAAGLAASTQPLAIVLAADMPHVAPSALRALLDRARQTPGHAIVPRREGRAEPLHAVYPTSLAGAARDALLSGDRKLTDFLARVPVEWVDAGELLRLPGAARTFDDVDAPADLDDPP